MSFLASLGYPLLGVGALNLLLGVSLLSSRRSDPVRPYAAAMAVINALFCVSMGIAYVLAGHHRPYDPYYRFAWVGWLSLAPFFQVVFVLKGDPRRARWWGAGLYAFWGVVLVLCMSTDYVEIGATSLAPFVDRIGPLEQPLRALGSLTLFYSIYQMWQAHQQCSGRRRQQTAYLLLGMALYACAGVTIAGVFQLTKSVSFDPGLTGYFSVVWMALTAYAIHKHRLFDIRFVLSRGFTALVMTALFAGVQLGLFSVIAPVLSSSNAIVLTTVCAALLLFMTPLLSFVQKGVERLFVRRRYEYQRALKESAQALAASVRVEDVLKELVKVTRDTMGVSSGAVLVREDDCFFLKESFGDIGGIVELDARGGLGRWFADHGGIFVRDEQEGMLEPAVLDEIDAELRRARGVAALPVSYHGTLSAIVVLGGKRDKDAYLQTDIDLLETLATETGIALANAQLLEEREQAIRMRDEFLSVAGHELRTPLTALQLNVQSLLESPPDDARVRNRLSATERQVARLDRLTNELLDVSRITAHRLKIEREQLDLVTLGRDVAARFTEELRRSNTPLELRLDEKVTGFWDRLRIEQVLSNLLSNAIKYGAGRPISMSIEQGPNGARVTVEDHGMGIEPADQRRIFDRFERAVSQNHYGGFGLGLWITKQVVEAHGGTVVVRSERGRGSSFIVELPSSGGAA